MRSDLLARANALQDDAEHMHEQSAQALSARVVACPEEKEMADDEAEPMLFGGLDFRGILDAKVDNSPNDSGTRFAAKSVLPWTVSPDGRQAKRPSGQ